jgi:hypothetical protein
LLPSLLAEKAEDNGPLPCCTASRRCSESCPRPGSGHQIAICNCRWGQGTSSHRYHAEPAPPQLTPAHAQPCIHGRLVAGDEAGHQACYLRRPSQLQAAAPCHSGAQASRAAACPACWPRPGLAQPPASLSDAPCRPALPALFGQRLDHRRHHIACRAQLSAQLPASQVQVQVQERKRPAPESVPSPVA